MINPDTLTVPPERAFLHLSIDLETLGLTPTAALVQVGVHAWVQGHPDMTKRLHEAKLGQFSRTFGFDPERTGQPYASVDSEAIHWWQTSPKCQEARQMISDEIDAQEQPVAIREALVDLNQFILTAMESMPVCDGLKVWGNGSIFDVTIIETHFRANKLKPLWPFWHIRDMRTVKDAAQMMGIPHLPINDISAPAHTAMADAEQQGRHIEYWLDAMRGLANQVADAETDGEDSASEA